MLPATGNNFEAARARDMLDLDLFPRNHRYGWSKSVGFLIRNCSEIINAWNWYKKTATPQEHKSTVEKLPRSNPGYAATACHSNPIVTREGQCFRHTAKDASNNTSY